MVPGEHEGVFEEVTSRQIGTRGLDQRADGTPFFWIGYCVDPVVPVGGTPASSKNEGHGMITTFQKERRDRRKRRRSGRSCSRTRPHPRGAPPAEIRIREKRISAIERDGLRSRISRDPGVRKIGPTKGAAAEPKIAVPPPGPA